jgi:hypothetical protein
LVRFNAQMATPEAGRGIASETWLMGLEVPKIHVGIASVSGWYGDGARFAICRV